MSFEQSRWTELPERIFHSRGITAWAVAPVAPVDYDDVSYFRSWLGRGHHAGMAYMERYPDIRTNPALLLEGARSIVCCAIPYAVSHPHAWVSAYALGSDYHDVVREILTDVAEEIVAIAGGKFRICVDSAPLRERYWAVRSGLGMRGMSGHVIVPGLGTACFLGEIITTAPFAPRRHTTLTECERCGRCIRACPTGALRTDGTVNAGQCLSYLTIEHRGDFSSEVNLHSRLYGCDACTLACPHTRNRTVTDADICPELMPRKSMSEITPEKVVSMTQDEFSAIFSGSSIKRVKLSGLRRNALHLLNSMR
ncbi:MAG: tRNA epoxyqueuosine(34) reductase QueG [Paramuribaculum sp.]|nr:tRNA epoxyqueuosine(34) reductase QueG [Paramuribaculum sp.]